MNTVKDDGLFWVYILLCENGSYYTGYTNNLDKRFASHTAGTASKYTRSFKPVKIAQSWKISGKKSDAMKVERLIKKMTRQEKEHIINHPDDIPPL